MSGFSLLWGKILESSLWIKESKETRLVWIAMLAMKDKEGVIQCSVVGLADRAKVSPEECRSALMVLTSPDLDDTSKVDHGRRVRTIPGGWQIVNHGLYQFSTEARREAWRLSKQNQRRRTKSKPLPGEQSFLKTGETPHEFRDEPVPYVFKPSMSDASHHRGGSDTP